MMIKIRYFAALVDKLGMASEEMALPENIDDVRGLVSLFQHRGGVWETVFGNVSLQITVNKQFSDLATPIKNGDEIAFISA